MSACQKTTQKRKKRPKFDIFMWNDVALIIFAGNSSKSMFPCRQFNIFYRSKGPSFTYSRTRKDAKRGKMEMSYFLHKRGSSLMEIELMEKSAETDATEYYLIVDELIGNKSVSSNPDYFN